MSKEINMNEDNGEEPGVFKNIDCFDAFNISHILTRDFQLTCIFSTGFKRVCILFILNYLLYMVGLSIFCS